MLSIVFIETNKSGSSREAIKAAEAMGYFTILLTAKQKFLSQREEFPDVHEMYFIEDLSVEKIKEKLTFLSTQSKKLKAIISFIDQYVYRAAQLTKLYCDSNMNSEFICKMLNKIQTRKALKHYNFTPFFSVYNQHSEDLKLFIKENKNKLPLMVKSPLSTGSKDVIYVKTPSEFKKAMRLLISKYPEVPVLIEEYLKGQQYLAEILVHNGSYTIVAFVEQTLLEKERFIVIGYGLLPEISEILYNKLHQLVSSIVDEFNMDNGSFHIELKYSDDQLKLIEMNPRISGGVMNSLIEAGSGINLAREIVNLHVGERVNMVKTKNQYAYARYLITHTTGVLEKVTGKNRALSLPGVERVYIKPRKGAKMGSPLSMGDRCGYVLATGGSLTEAKARALEASQEIEFHIAQDKERGVDHND
ncbi:ATP-grasp domain-containing protein [Bacillus weihaiensis]|uniref:ATP-grasp domain-containing protein n=1 Tax=Bacillus weihaiensis TaxID=1547283 RepID=A0A1L3MPW6_9BACI|nr:ATP-grasp domain-containing protein [Bacillus weihaiensis]APH04284.1 hypothetical protein A9C19_05745 [Bacillus weihaiensis]